MTTKPCPKCGGSGEVPVSRSVEAVLDWLRAAHRAVLSSEIAAALGLSMQRTDGILGELAALELAQRLPGRTAGGYEWQAERLPTADDVYGILSEKARHTAENDPAGLYDDQWEPVR